MNRARLAVAILAAAAIILSAAFISQVRNYIRDTFPGQFILILGAIVGGSLVIALTAAIIRIKDRRRARYGCIAAAVVIGALYSFWMSSPDPQVAAVERFHFVQYGLLTFLFYRAWRPLNDAGVLVLPVLAAMLTATIEEWFQWFIPGRVGTVQDVFLNWVAVACGLLFSVGVDPPQHSVGRISSPSMRHIRITAVVFVIMFGMFFDSVHVGHQVQDPRVGSFASIYSMEELTLLAKDRAARWPANPPVDKTRLAREDQFRTEGMQHVKARNEAWERGDVVSAWQENAILELYYAPVLDTGHRWPAEQREDAGRRFAASHGESNTFISAAYPYQVHAWSEWKHWSVVVALAMLILLVPRLRRRS
jgi:VanZ family protein